MFDEVIFKKRRFRFEKIAGYPYNKGVVLND